MIPIKGSAPSPKIPGVTVALIAVNSLAFLFMITMDSEAIRTFVRTWGFVPAEFWEALEHNPGALEAWLVPLFTSLFLHGGWGHIIGNMLFLWVFGDGVENRIGHGRFLLFYILAGLAASLVHAAVAAGSTMPTVGASGAIAGVLGAYLVLYPRARIVLIIPIFFWPFFFQLPALAFLVIWFVEQLMFGAMFAARDAAMGGVAWGAHIGGFIAGALLVKLMAIGREVPEQDESRFFDEENDGQPAR